MKDNINTLLFNPIIETLARILLDIGVLASSLKEGEYSVTETKTAETFTANWKDAISKGLRTYEGRLGS